MHILILGGGGFLGQKLAAQLVVQKTINVQGSPGNITSIQLLDKYWPVQPVEHPLLEYTTGDITDEEIILEALQRLPDVIFHLAAVVSGEAEKNFDLGLQVNLLANLRLLERIRTLKKVPVLVFSSTCAAFGGDPAATVLDDTMPWPQSSYGTQKVMTEYLISDYSRRGWVHGRSLRLPTIAVRPGKPNAATSSFVSSMIREPLQGLRASCPVSDNVYVWILSPNKVIYNLIHAAALTNKRLGYRRMINLPGQTVQIRQWVAALDKIAGYAASAFIDWTPDEFIQKIVLTWPPFFDTSLAEKLGFQKDERIEDIIQAFVTDELRH